MDRDNSGLQQTVDLLLGLLLLSFLAWMMWLTMVRPRTPILRVRLLRSSTRLMSGLARLTGAHSMWNELQTGVEDYRLPYWLSLRRDQLERETAAAAESLRP